MKTKKLNSWKKKTTSFSSQNYFEDTTNSSHQSNSTKMENKVENSDTSSVSSIEDILDNFNFTTINQFLQNTLNKKKLLPDSKVQKTEQIFNEDCDTKMHFKFSIKNIGGIKHSKASFSNIINDKNEEKFFTENVKKMDKEGKIFEEKQEMYKNSITGVKKNAISKKYDDKEIKVIYKKNIFTGDTETHNILKNVKEDEVDKFQKNFDEGNFCNEKNECSNKMISNIPYSLSKLKIGKRKYFHKKVIPVNPVKVLGFSKSQI